MLRYFFLSSGLGIKGIFSGFKLIFQIFLKLCLIKSRPQKSNLLVGFQKQYPLFFGNFLLTLRYNFDLFENLILLILGICLRKSARFQLFECFELLEIFQNQYGSLQSIACWTNFAFRSSYGREMLECVFIFRFRILFINFWKIILLYLYSWIININLAQKWAPKGFKVFLFLL